MGEKALARNQGKLFAGLLSWLSEIRVTMLFEQGCQVYK